MSTRGFTTSEQVHPKQSETRRVRGGRKAGFVCRCVVGMLFVLLSLWLRVGDVWAYPSDLVWRTLETEHFRISYHQGLEQMAVQVARMSEAVHAELVSLLEYESGLKTEVVLVDHVDSPNGFVNVYPYNKTALYAVPPEADSALNDYDDWLRVLVSHEHTHVVALDTKSGLPRVINHIFGGLLQPNQAVPRWYSEGMAVFHESFFTSGGRERSSVYEMYLRTDVLEDNFREIDQIGSNGDIWPRATLWYLYGAKFMQYLADKYGQKTFAALGYLYGQRLIPFALNTVLDKITDDDFIRLYDEWHQVLVERYRADAARLKALGLTEINYITDGGEEHRSPVLFPTGDKLLYFHGPGRPYQQGLAVLDMNTLEHEIVYITTVDGGASVAPDGRRIVFSQVGYSRKEYAYHELYLHDLQEGTTEQITKNKRAREPSFAPDGKRVAYVRYAPGRAFLEIMNIDSGRTVCPLPPESFDQIFTPAFSPDGRYLAFTGWRLGGFKDVYMLDLQTNRLLAVTNDNALDASPSWSFDGRWLFWSSDRTGINNIYAHDMQTGRTHQLTNVLNGVFTPMASPDGRRLFASSYHKNGYDLAWIDLTQTKLGPLPDEPELRPSRSYYDPEVPYEEKEYSPFPSLYPKVWRPTWGEDHDGMTLGVSIWGNDIVGNHSWTLDASMGVFSADPTIGVAYAYRGFYPTLSVNASHVSYSLIDAGIKDGQRVDQDEARTSGSFSVSIPFRRREYAGNMGSNYSHTLSFSAGFRHTRLLNRYEYEPLESAPVYADTGLSTSVRLAWSYQDRDGEPGFVATARGRSMSIAVRAETDLLGGKFNSIAATASYAEYIPMPYIKGHSLALKIEGGIGASDYKNRALFFIGGPPDQDIVDDLIRNERSYGNYLRGYEPLSQAGDRYAMFKSEYRFVAWQIDRGIYTLPIYFRRLHFAPFFDAGYAWTSFDAGEIRYGYGGEVRLDMLLGYFTPVTLRMGVQSGPRTNGKTSLFFGLDNLF